MRHSTTAPWRLLGLLALVGLLLGLLAMAPADARSDEDDDDDDEHVVTPPPGGGSTPVACSDASLAIGPADFSSYQAVVEDPGNPGIRGIGYVPPTHDGGTFQFSLDLQGPSCAGATYTVFVERNDLSDDPANLVAFHRVGDGSDPIVLAASEFIFDGYDDTCVRAHVLITTAAGVERAGWWNSVCGGGGGGRTWG